VPLGLFGLLVAVDNVIDYGTNYAFVQHVFSMDTTFPGNALMGRAITDPAVWRLGLWRRGVDRPMFPGGALLVQLRAPRRLHE
jgi:predicted small integral membrane protein